MRQRYAECDNVVRGIMSRNLVRTGFSVSKSWSWVLAASDTVRDVVAGAVMRRSDVVERVVGDRWAFHALVSESVGRPSGRRRGEENHEACMGRRQGGALHVEESDSGPGVALSWTIDACSVNRSM